MSTPSTVLESVNDLLASERVIIHEISHLNQFSDQGYVGHVSDRKIKLQNRQTGEDVWLTCYGAYLSRLLARWTKQGVGTATQTNGT